MGSFRYNFYVSNFFVKIFLFEATDKNTFSICFKKVCCAFAKNNFIKKSKMAVRKSGLVIR